MDASNFMMHPKYLYKSIIGLLLFSCNVRTETKVEKVTMAEGKTKIQVLLPSPPMGLKVSAHLIFDDKSISSFDILNDKTIALWNTIIGAGDALKPSHKTKIILTGKTNNPARYF